MYDEKDYYRRLIEDLPDAFAYHRVITGDNGDPVDYVYLDVNSAFLQMTGLTREMVIGSKASELHTAYSESTFDWVKAFGQVAETGESIRFERYFEMAGSYCDIIVYSNKKAHCAVLYRNISSHTTREKELLESGVRAKLKLQAILSPRGSFEEFNLADFIDVPALQEIMDNFFSLAGIGVSVVDNSGKILVSTGWQDICTKFHRVHPETKASCIESDIFVSNGVSPGEFKLYKCKNNMWDIATPIVIGNKKLGSLFLGQFFFDDEEIDYALFRKQAYMYGFNEEEYIEALNKVPRWSRNTVETVMKFYTQLVSIISSLSYSNIDKAHLLAERDHYIANQKKAEENLVKESGLRSALLDNIPGCIAFILKKDSREIVATNKLGYEIGALPGLTCYQTSADRGDPCPFCLAPEMWESGEIQRAEIEYRGTWYEGFWAPLTSELYVHYIFNITERKQSEERIRYLSFHDQLTGLYNRHYLEEEMLRLDTERQLPISIIMSDLNNLKLVNDTYGHVKGDEMLKKAAAILVKNCRDEDIIARWGGDEFLIYLPRTPESKASEICWRINENYRADSVADVPITMSFGVATKTSVKTELSDVFKNAEDRMYQNKLNESRSEKSDIFDALLEKVAEKSFKSQGHNSSVQSTAFYIARKLNLSASEQTRLKLLVTLCNIGYINISEEILLKKTALTEADWEIIKKHPETGYRIVRTAEGFAHVADEILAHHERWDGSGYPRGLTGAEIPLLSRILAVAEAYEVMRSGRPYKKAMSTEEIALEFESCAGKQFDPVISEVILDMIRPQKGNHS